MLNEADPIWPFYKVTEEVQRAYKNVFGAHTIGAKAVLADLARLCFAFASTSTEREQGMRDVWLHIQKRLMLTDEELVAVLAGLRPEQRAAMFDRKPVFASVRIGGAEN